MNELEHLIARRFDLLAETFPSRIDENDARLKSILHKIENLNGKNILEVGCGKGRISRIFKLNGASVYGIDISESLLREAKDIRPFYFLKAEACRIPFKEDTFDAVVLLEVIEHIPAISSVLEDLARVLKKDGILIIVDRNKFSLNNRRFMVPNVVIKRYHELKNEWMYPKDFPFREIWFSPRLINKLFRKYFNDTGYEYVLSDGERKKWWHFVFKMIPQTRHFVLWYGKNKAEFRGAGKLMRYSAAIKKFGISGAYVKEKVAKDSSIIALEGAGNPLNGVFCLRIDADEYDRGSFACYYSLFKAHKSAITIFFNAGSFRDARFEIENCKRIGIDIQSHGFYHHTYNDYESNRYNIRKAKLFFEDMGVRAEGFASPMGKWNWTLMKALEDEGYKYSSDFAYDYLSLPSYPVNGKIVSGILEIPIFPVAPELFYQSGMRNKEEITVYYRNAIDEMIKCNLPVIIYAHTSVQYKGVPQIIDEIMKYAILERKLMPTNMTEISHIWKQKHLSAKTHSILGVPAEEYMGIEAKETIYDGIKNIIRNSIDFERVTPVEELHGPWMRRAFKRYLRRLL